MGQQQSACSGKQNHNQITKVAEQIEYKTITEIKANTQVTGSALTNKKQLKESTRNNMLISKNVSVSVLEKKCQFVYIKPVKLQNMDVYLNGLTIDAENDQILHENKVNDNKNKNKNQHNFNKLQQKVEKQVEKQAKKNIEPQVQNSEEEISIRQSNMEQTQDLNRILVQWSSFIKIKKKNYLEDYIHIKQIGEGAFGTVSKIKMKYGGMFRAAKIVKMSALAKKKAQQQKFISQILIPMKTDHPNLNKLYEVFQWKNQYVMIMELCQGGDLFSCIKTQKAFTQSKVADIMKQIMSGIVYLHKNNIVHRDLKPENMLYDTESKLLKIIDFGTAIELPPGKKLTSTIGTPYYIAPQVLAGEYNQKCDVWSCGVILYIMLSGTPPFFGRDENQIMNNIRNPIWNKRSKDSKKLVMQMLNKNYNERLSALEVLNSDWINNSSKYENKELGLDAIKNLQTFHFQNKLKAVVYTYIASQLYSNKDKQKLLQCFRQIDEDGDGVIGKQELIAVFKKHHDSSSDIDESYIDKILKIVDTNGSGLIDFTQFLVAASNEQELLQKQRLENAFSYLDTDHSGYITAEEIKPFLDDSQQTSEDIRKIFDQVDINGDGKISKREFVSLLLKKH